MNLLSYILGIIGLYYLFKFFLALLKMPIFWIMFACLFAILIRKTIKQNKKEKERLQKLKIRTRLQFMDFNTLRKLNGFEFEDYFAKQLNFLEIKNRLTKKNRRFWNRHTCVS